VGCGQAGNQGRSRDGKSTTPIQMLAECYTIRPSAGNLREPQGHDTADTQLNGPGDLDLPEEQGGEQR
jgi:hypothetical protein